MDWLNLVNKIEHFYTSWGYFLVFISSFIETTPFGWAIPGGSILAAGGFFAYDGKISLVKTITAGWLGQWFTFMLAYLIGKKSGNFLIKKLNQEKNARRARFLLNKNGGVILTTSMFANLTRFWVAYIAGTQSYKPLYFVFYSGIASLSWSSLMITIGYLAGSRRSDLEKGVASLGILSWFIVFAVILFIYIKIKKDFKEFENEDVKN